MRRGGSIRLCMVTLEKWLRMLFEGDNYMGVSKNRGTPKSSILIGFALINHPFWGTFIFGNTHMFHHYFQGHSKNCLGPQENPVSFWDLDSGLEVHSYCPLTARCSQRQFI